MPEILRVILEIGKAGRSWPIQFPVRRIAHHVMDHTWEWRTGTSADLPIVVTVGDGNTSADGLA